MFWVTEVINCGNKCTRISAAMIVWLEVAEQPQQGNEILLSMLSIARGRLRVSVTMNLIRINVPATFDFSRASCSYGMCDPTKLISILN